MTEYMTIAQAADYLKKCPQTVVIAIKKERIKSIKIKGRRLLLKIDVENYEKTRYSHKNRKLNGEVIYDESKGRMSIKDAASYLKCSYQRICYLIRRGSIPHYFMGSSKFIKTSDLENLNQKNKIEKTI